jgi:hypothetical protein
VLVLILFSRSLSHNLWVIRHVNLVFCAEALRWKGTTGQDVKKINGKMLTQVWSSTICCCCCYTCSCSLCLHRCLFAIILQHVNVARFIHICFSRLPRSFAFSFITSSGSFFFHFFSFHARLFNFCAATNDQTWECERKQEKNLKIKSFEKKRIEWNEF